MSHFIVRDRLSNPNSKFVPEPVSLVLATRDTAEVIKARVANLLDTDYPYDLIEVIVAMDSSMTEKGVCRSISEDKRVRLVVASGEQGKANALNAGVVEATNELLVMCDSKQSFNRRTISELSSSMMDHRYGAISGSLQLGGSGTPMHYYWEMEKWLRKHEAAIHSSVGVSGAIYATRKSLWRALPSGTILDDLHFPMTLVLDGHRVGFCEKAVAVDLRTFNDDAEKGRKERTLTGVIQLLYAIPSVINPRRNDIFIQFVCHKLLRYLTPVFVLLMAISVASMYVSALRHGGDIYRMVLIITPLTAILIPRVRRLVLASMRWAILLQKSIVVALINGVSGKYDVWKQSH